MSVKLRRHKKKQIALIGCVMLAAVAAIISVYVFYDNLQQEVAVSCNDDYNPTPPVTVENKGESTLFESNDMLIENEVVTKDLLNEKSDWFDKEDRLVEHSFMEGVIPVTLNGSAISNEKLTTSESGVQHITTFDETITYQGKKYDLVRSYYKKNLDKMKEYDIHVWPDTETARRTDTMSAGGITVIGEYIPSVETEDETKPRPNPKVTVTTRYINVQTNSYVKPETVEKAEYGSSITKRAEAITGMIYIRSNYSTDNGMTWKNKSQDSLTIDNIKDDVIINFYYSPQGEIAANLTLRAAPNNIKQGQSEAVEFTLDASGSYCDEHTKIVKYEYWLQTADNFGINPDYTEASQIKTAFKYNVKPNSTYYGKVRITDGFGNTAEAVAEIYIGELYVEPAATAKADLQIVLAQNNYYTLSYEEFGSWVNGIGSHRYRMEIRIPEEYQYDLNGIWRDDDIGIDFALDASRSTSTNGINPYHFIVPYLDTISTLGLGNKLNEQELQTSSATTNIFSHTFKWSIEDAYNGIPHRDMYDSEWAVDFFHLTVTDSEDAKASDRISSYLIYIPANRNIYHDLRGSL